MQRRTFMQALTGLFAGLLIPFRATKAAVARAVRRATSPLARWRHIEPTPVVHSFVRSRTPGGNGDDAKFTQEGFVVAEMLRPTHSYTLLRRDEDGSRDTFRAALREAEGEPYGAHWEPVPDSSPKWTREEFLAAERKLRFAKRTDETYEQWYARRDRPQA